LSSLIKIAVNAALLMLPLLLLIGASLESSTYSLVYCYNYGAGSATDVYVEAVISTDGTYGYGRAIITGYKAPFGARAIFYANFIPYYDSGIVRVDSPESREFFEVKPSGVHSSVASVGYGYYPLYSVDSSAGVFASTGGLCGY